MLTYMFIGLASLVILLLVVVALQPSDFRARFWTAVAERSGDTAFERTKFVLNLKASLPYESGVALRFPPQSTISL